MHIANCWYPEEQDIYSTANVPSFLSAFFELNATTGILQYKTPGPVLTDVVPGSMMFYADMTSGDPEAPTCYMKPLTAEGEPEASPSRLGTV